ncbi:LysR family transcriptional regulator [Citrobacter amalonaticus]|uniref:LysR family transcriptional regulator n=1 Tax=Citrobacter amalonaticus TaxID=35703 RepID=UPI00300DAEAE
MNFLLTKKLKYFMTVMEKQCLNKACEELFITRSPLGKTINELETFFGKKLFLRQHGLFSPTDYAKEIYEQTEPLYRKIVNTEKELLGPMQGNRITIVIDKSFPDNLADILECSLGKSDFSYTVVRMNVRQETLENDELNNRTIIISTTHFPVPDKIATQCHHSSAMLLITNKENKDDLKNLEKIPLLVRENMLTISHQRIAFWLEKYVNFHPKVQAVQGSLLDFMVMTSNGAGFMLLPLTTCEMMNINRQNTILMDHMKMNMHYYYQTKTKHAPAIKNIIKYIDRLF